jgi:hypothetical protein
MTSCWLLRHAADARGAFDAAVKMFRARRPSYAKERGRGAEQEVEALSNDQHQRSRANDDGQDRHDETAEERVVAAHQFGIKTLTLFLSDLHVGMFFGK